jgi:hypothetical protein
MKRADAMGAFEDFGTNEELTALVGFRLRHVAYSAEVELPSLPVKAILRGQALADWRTRRAHANVIARTQIAGWHARHEDVLTVSGASYRRTVQPKTANAQHRPGWARAVWSLDVCYGHG